MWLNFTIYLLMLFSLGVIITKTYIIIKCNKLMKQKKLHCDKLINETLLEATFVLKALTWNLNKVQKQIDNLEKVISYTKDLKMLIKVNSLIKNLYQKKIEIRNSKIRDCYKEFKA